jgi:hypothetical protein
VRGSAPGRPSAAYRPRPFPGLEAPVGFCSTRPRRRGIAEQLVDQVKGVGGFRKGDHIESWCGEGNERAMTAYLSMGWGRREHQNGSCRGF